MKKIISAKNIALIAIGLVLGLGATYAMAWTAPTVAPTGGNVPAPINTGATAQSKIGTFGTLGLLNAGNRITTTGNGSGGTIMGRILRATGNICLPGDPCLFDPDTAFVAAEKFCLVGAPGTPASGVPGSPGYNCLSSATGWGSSLAAGTQIGQTLSWGWPTAGAWSANSALKVTGDVPYPDSVTTPGVVISEGNANLSSPALGVRGKIRIEGGNPVPGKVLTVEPGSTSGVGTWQSLGSQVFVQYESSYSLGYGTSRRVHATCPNNYRVIGGGGSCLNNDTCSGSNNSQGHVLCTDGGIHGYPAGVMASYPASSSNTLMGAGYKNDNMSFVGSSGTLNAWMVTCYESKVQQAYAICVPDTI